MRILFFGDVVGHSATCVLVRRMPEIRREHRPDAVVVNAENCAPDGFGMGREEIDMLFSAGVDVITGGNHSWDDDESVELLAHPRVLRPANVAGAAGKGVAVVECDSGPLTVVNLMDPRAIHGWDGLVGPPYATWLETERRGTVVVDFHGDHVFHKQVFAHAVDGQAAAVLGTHSHEATLRLHRLPGGTALVSDVGMTGPVGGVQGFAAGPLVRGLVRHGDPYTPPLPGVVEGEVEVNGVVLTTEDGRTTDLRRVR